MGPRVEPSTEELRRYVAPPPELIGLEITARCNLQCPMCHRHGTMPHSFFQEQDMRLDALERVAPVLTTARQVLLTGGGEPFLVSELADFIDECHKINPNIEVMLISNGVLLTEKRARMVIEKRVHGIDFSMDGHIQYGHVGGGADFDKVKDNIGRLARLKREYGLDEPHIRIAFVAMRDNLCEIPNIIDFAAEVGAAVYFQPLSPATEEQRNQNVFRHVDYTLRMLEAGKAKAQQMGVIFDPLNMSPDLSLASHGGCVVPSKQFWIGYEGVLAACCGGVVTGSNIHDPDVHAEDVWNSAMMLRLRWELDTGNYNEICRRCPTLRNTVEDQERAVSVLDDKKRIRELEDHIAAIQRGRVMRLLRIADRMLGRA
jgi:MoaA/NifB/PqqE/SkfB family radical SAM enzyme